VRRREVGERSHLACPLRENKKHRNEKEKKVKEASKLKEARPPRKSRYPYQQEGKARLFAISVAGQEISCREEKRRAERKKAKNLRENGGAEKTGYHRGKKVSPDLKGEKKRLTCLPGGKKSVGRLAKGKRKKSFETDQAKEEIITAVGGK